MPFRDLTFARVCLLGAAIAALGLSGCGRKGALDLPPSASAVPQDAQPAAQPAQPGTGLTSPFGSQPAEPADQKSVIGQRAGVASDGRPIAPIGEKRRIPLDVLID